MIEDCSILKGLRSWPWGIRWKEEKVGFRIISRFYTKKIIFKRRSPRGVLNRKPDMDIKNRLISLRLSLAMGFGFSDLMVCTGWKCLPEHTAQVF
jgi:hypothetical protein